MMSSWFKKYFGYGLGVGTAKAIFGDGKSEGGGAGRGPIRQQTEEEILADEKRYDEEARRLDAEDATAKRSGAR